MPDEYTVTGFVPRLWNNFEHRQVVFTRLARAGNGRDTAIAQVLQIWDVETNSMIIELTPNISLYPHTNNQEGEKHD